MIDSSEISVVVQGPVYKDVTPKCLDSIRRALPRAEIILSTWEGADVSELGDKYDQLLLNPDPGGFPLIKNENRKNNINRQIVSSRNGIKKATRKFCLKYRSDFELKDDKFLSHFGKFPARAEDWKILKERVLVNYATHPLFRAFHPTDITCFGLTEDVLNMWDIPLADEEHLFYFERNPYPEIYHSPFGEQLIPRVGAEMYVWTSFLKKHGKINFRHNWDGTPENVHLTELTIANNLQVLNREEFDFVPLLHPYLLGEDARFSWMDEKLWEYYYKKHCVKNIPCSDLEFHIYYPLKLLKYHLRYSPRVPKILRRIFKKI